ncbi:MAG TPA: MarR family transcriptional regulator [Dehalococcoidia bacterium]|nr:MarR family transcriptional regulator [Dehalococcoidia bacterium]
MATDFLALANFRYTIRRFLKMSEEAAQSAGLEPQQHQLLLALKARSVADEDTSIAVLAEGMLLKHHSVVGLIDRLEEKGFVSRCRDDKDRRRVEIQLTQLGDDTIEHLTAAHQRELNVLAPELIEVLQSIFDKVRPEGSTD